MSDLRPSEFNRIVDQLNNYGQKGFEEIAFRDKNDHLVPVATEKPNFFFRLIRWLFQGGYQEASTAEQVINFLEENHFQIFDNQEKINNLKQIFLQRIVKPEERRIVEQRFDDLIARIQEIAQENPTFRDIRASNAGEFLSEWIEQDELEIERESEFTDVPIADAVPLDSSIQNQPIHQPDILDVPDDGNCLFYSLSIGLRKKYADHSDVQEKLGWKVGVEQLTGDLSKEDEMLAAPAKHLREQAAKYLKDHQGNDEIMLALMEGIGSHLEVARRKIQEEEAVIPILMMDIEELEQQPQTPSVIRQLKEKKEHMEVVRKSIEFQKANMPDEDDLQGYIDLAQKDHVYCGVAQLLALSKEYNIPIRVFYDDQYEQVFNAEAAGTTKPILSVKYVNGNHFQFVND